MSAKAAVAFGNSPIGSFPTNGYALYDKSLTRTQG
jgi:hypothetical protein